MLIYYLDDEQSTRWWPLFRDVVSPPQHVHHHRSLELKSGCSIGSSLWQWWSIRYINGEFTCIHCGVLRNFTIKTVPLSVVNVFKKMYSAIREIMLVVMKCISRPKVRNCFWYKLSTSEPERILCATLTAEIQRPAHTQTRSIIWVSVTEILHFVTQLQRFLRSACCSLYNTYPCSPHDNENTGTHANNNIIIINCFLF
jgi:hypothetical protein